MTARRWRAQPSRRGSEPGNPHAPGGALRSVGARAADPRATVPRTRPRAGAARRPQGPGRDPSPPPRTPGPAAGAADALAVAASTANAFRGHLSEPSAVPFYEAARG